MSVLIYIKPVNSASQTFLDAITGALQRYEIEVYREMALFESRLKQPMGEIVVCVALLGDVESFKEFVLLGNRLERLKIVLAIPDWNAEMVTQSHTIFPRFMACLKMGPESLVAVLGKMLDGSSIAPIRVQRLGNSALQPNMSVQYSKEDTKEKCQ